MAGGLKKRTGGGLKEGRNEEGDRKRAKNVNMGQGKAEQRDREELKKKKGVLKKGTGGRLKKVILGGLKGPGSG